MVDEHGATEPDRRTAAVWIGVVVGLFVLTGAVNSMGGLNAILGQDAPGAGRRQPASDPQIVPQENHSRHSKSLAAQVYESGIPLSLAQQRLIAAVSRAHPRLAGQAGRIISLGDSVCQRLDRGHRPALVAAAFMRNGIPNGAAEHITEASIEQRCPEYNPLVR